MYLLRHSAASISPALYDPDKEQLAVRILEFHPDNHSASHQAAFIQIGNEDSPSNKQQLNYRQLLELVLNLRKS